MRHQDSINTETQSTQRLLKPRVNGYQLKQGTNINVAKCYPFCDYFNFKFSVYSVPLCLIVLVCFREHPVNKSRRVVFPGQQITDLPLLLRIGLLQILNLVV